MGFPSEPGRDDASLPPVNVVVPDDARDLDRDVLAYRREMRVRRRQQRFLRLFRPLRRPGFGGHAAIVPLIAVCLALSLVGGALLSVATISPASAPTFGGSPRASAAAVPAPILTSLPAGTVQLSGNTVPLRSLVSSVIALIPANCGCGPELGLVSAQASSARVRLYFVATGAEIRQLAAITVQYGHGNAQPAADSRGVLSAAYHPAGLIVLFVFSDATAVVRRNPGTAFSLGTTPSSLMLPGRSQVPEPPPAARPTPG